MLLRLLPLPTESNPTPLTILFTLPLPAHPYTSRSLPLPPALLSHRNLCLQEDIPCTNVLLGESSSWISGVVEDITFSLPLMSVAVNFIDGSRVELPVTRDCEEALGRVIGEVEMSFRAVQPQAQAMSPRTSTSSVASSASSSSSSSGSSSGSSRKTPSSLLLSLLSPLLPNSPQTTHAATSTPTPALPARPTIPTPSGAGARFHRRQARSILVDTYRLHVLPSLKAQLPSAYLQWSIRSELGKRMADFTVLKGEIEGVIQRSGLDVSKTQRLPSLTLARCRTTSGSSAESFRSYESYDESEDDSDIESPPSPLTPATSIFSSSSGCPTPNPAPGARAAPTPSPQAFLLSIPPAHALPPAYRASYAALLVRLTHLASRVNQLKKLGGRYAREEGKRTWLEGLERGRMADKALRRAWSNMEAPIAQAYLVDGRGGVSAEPVKASRLWRSFTAEDLARGEAEAREARHPAMMSDDESASESEAESDSDGESADEPMPLTPTAPIRPPMPSLTASVCASPTPHPVEIAEQRGDVLHIRRVAPPAYVMERTPELVASRSVDSLSETELPELDSWDRDDCDATASRGMGVRIRVGMGKVESAMERMLLAGPVIKAKWAAAASAGAEDGEDELAEGFYGQCGIHV
ncbi:hypothetical protein IAT38_008084 [Cryptococcus sp. DSM 104549]